MDKPSHHIKRSHLFERTLPLFLVIVTAIIVVFQAQILLEVRSEIAELKVAVLAHDEVCGSVPSIEPFAALEENCTTCHSERRFTGFHGGHGTDDITTMISHGKNGNMGLALSPTDVDRVHDSILLLHCVKCHDEGSIKALAGMSSAKRLQVIEKMREKPGANISDEETRTIERAIQDLQGF